MLKRATVFLLSLGMLAAGCGTADEEGSFEGVVNVNGTEYRVASDCLLAQAGETVLVTANDISDAGDFHGFSMSWSSSVVLRPGTYDVSTESMSVRIKRANPTNPDGGLSSTVNGGTVVFEQLDAASLVSGRFVGLRMERDNDDEQTVFVVDGAFTCRP